MSNWTRGLTLLGACEEAIEWCKKYESLEDVWQVCERGDWMLWLAGRILGEPESDSRTLDDVRKAAYYAHYAAYHAADVAAANASYAANYAIRNSILKQCADIVRKEYPNAPKL